MDLLERNGSMVTRHPWERARSRFFIRLIQRLAVHPTPTSLLDVGSGDAWFAAQLAPTLPNESHITCWDVNYSNDYLASEPTHSPGLSLTAEQPDRTFNGLLMLDVIEHVENDLGFVTHIVETWWDPGGWILGSVPAYQ